ncbi:hypothetical protein GcM3_017025 [Golovinomyces cichoracearum]|uniref:Uncharacterized protein n=1 Tax=Golovinomyces cichoracearum TaxID=62708 RepID=A0A420J8J9_9PEZI|nr:hypothetical protein GcM3_017025 [Golovinomyces cichoracearum]
MVGSPIYKDVAKIGHETLLMRQETAGLRKVEKVATEVKSRKRKYIQTVEIFTVVAAKDGGVIGGFKQNVSFDGVDGLLINYVYMRKEKTLFRQLLALKRQFAPTDRAKELRPVTTWLDNLQRAYDKAVECQLPEVIGYRSQYHFIHAISNIDIEYSKYLSFQLEKKRKSGNIPQTVSMIEDFCNHQRQEEAMKSLEHPYLAKNLTKGVAATFKESEAEDGGSKTTNYDDKECLCGF